MRHLSLAFSVLFSASISFALSDPRASFKGEENWLLDVVLSDARKKASFDSEWAAAASGGPTAQENFTLRWRKEAVDFGAKYKSYLETSDILPNAGTIQEMVPKKEFDITNYWLSRQSPEVQARVRKDVSEGNAVIGFMRGRVESGVRSGRSDLAKSIGTYLDSEDAKQAKAYKPTLIAKGPKPNTPSTPSKDSDGKPNNALDQAKKAEEEANNGSIGSPEDAARSTDKSFSGGKDEDNTVNVPGELNWKNWQPRSGLSADLRKDPAGLSDISIAPPPNPLIDEKSKPENQSSAFGVLFKKFAPMGIGGIGGGLIGFLLGGPIGMLIGAVVGGFLGHKVGQQLDK